MKPAMRHSPLVIALHLGLSVLLLSCTSAPADSPTSTSPPADATPSSSTTSSSPVSPSPPVDPVAIDPAAPSDSSPASSTSPEAEQAQYLPITAEAMLGEQVIQLEVARTSEEKQMGLMYRPPLEDDRGMLFLFDPARPVRFWMKNTPSPLDMVFLYQGEVEAIVENALPCNADPCPTYGPNRPISIDQVIELRSGRASELGLQVGDRVEVQFLE